MEVVDARQYLFDIEMSDIYGEAAGLLDFVPEVTRIHPLMSKQRREVSKTSVE